MKDYNSFKEIQTDITKNILPESTPTYNGNEQSYTFYLKGTALTLMFKTERQFNVNAFYITYKEEPIYTAVYNNSKLSSNVKKKLAFKAAVRYVENLNGKTALKLARQMLNITDGGTFNLDGSPYVGNSGYVVAEPNHEIITAKDFNQITTALNLQLYILDYYNSILVNNNEKPALLGVWTFGGDIYLDLVNVYESKAHALELAKRYNQLAIFDLKESKEIFL